MPRNLNRPLRHLATLAIVLSASPAIALDACDEIERFLEGAGYAHQRADSGSGCGFEATAPGGGVLSVRPGQDGTSFELGGLRGVEPESGAWSRRIEPSGTTCLDGDAAGMLRGQISAFDLVLNRLMGSRDGGRSVPYQFSRPFAASQLTAPLFTMTEMAGIGSSFSYGDPDGHVFPIQGQLTQESDFTIDLRMQVGVVGPNLILGTWHGSHGNCWARGFVEWRRQ